MAYFERCPKCDSENISDKKRAKTSKCEDCGFESTSGESLPERESSVQVSVAFPEGLAPETLPIFLAYPLQSFLAERDERMKIYIAMESTEVLLRWVVAVALGELFTSSGQQLPQEVLMKFHENIERPTLGKWLGLLESLSCHAPASSLVAPKIFSLWKDTIESQFKQESKDGKGGTLENSFLVLRNQIAHGGGLSKSLAKDLLSISKYESRFVDLLRSVAVATAGCDIFAISGTTTVRLMGLTATSCPRPSVVPEQAEGVFLCNATAAIPLHPIAEYGSIFFIDTNGRLVEKPVAPAPQLYQRLGLKRLSYMPLGESALISESHKLQSFREFFRLDEAFETRSETVSAEGFAWDSSLNEARTIAEELIGRKAELQTLKDWIKSPERQNPQAPNIGWMQGGAGLGKSMLMAKIAADYANDQRRGIYFHRFRAGDSRNSKRSFLLLLQSALWHWSPLKAITEEPTAETLEGEKLTSDVKARLAKVKELKPQNEKAPRPLFMVLMDGLDEVALQEPLLVNLIKELAVEGTLFVCAGRPEHGLSEAFEQLIEQKRAEAFTWKSTTEKTLPPMSEADIREMLIEGLDGAKLELLKLDRDQRGAEKESKGSSIVVNPFIEAVVRNADGLPIYVRLVVEDVKTGVIELSEKVTLPKGLTNYYQKLLERLGVSDLQRDITLVVAILARSQEPLDESALMQLVAISENPDWGSEREAFRERIGNVLRYGATLLRQVETKDGTKGYGLYHQSFRDFVGGTKRVDGTEQTPPAEMLKGTVRRAETLLGQAATAWNALADGGGESNLRNHLFRWGTEYAVWWLGEAGAKQAKERLTSFDYVQARTKALPTNELYDLVSEYKLLLKYFPNELRMWEAFFREKQHILLRGNAEWGVHKILLQLAVEHADDSPITQAAERWLAEGKCDWVWLKRNRRPEKAGVSNCLFVLEGHTGGVNGAIELQDGRVLSWSDDSTLRIWNLVSSKCDAVLEGHTDSVKGAIELRDRRVLSWSWDETLRIWNSMSGQCVAVLEGHTGGVNGAIELQDGRVLSWSDDSTLRIWNLVSSKCDAVLEGHTDSVKGAIELQNGTLLSWSDDTKLWIWNLVNGKCLRVLKGHKHIVNGAIELRNGRVLSWSWDHSLRVWNPMSGKCLAVLKGHTFVNDNYDMVWGVKGAIELRNGRVMSWSVDSTLRIWNIMSGKCTAVLKGLVDGAIELQNGNVLSWSIAKALKIWDTASGKCVATLEGHSGIQSAIELRDGHKLSWSNDGTMWIWNVESQKSMAMLEGHTREVEGAIELQERRVLSWSSDKTLRIWDTVSGKCISVLEGHTGGVRGAIELRNGRVLSWSWNNNVIPDRSDKTKIVWNSNSGKCLTVLRGHLISVEGAIELKDGRVLSWSDDKTYRLWNPRSGTCLKTIERSKFKTKNPKLYAEYQQKRNPNQVQNTLIGQFNSRMAYLETNNSTICFWQAESEAETRHLFENGIMVVTQVNGQVCFLNTYVGDKGVTLSELEAYLQSSKNLTKM
jgi:WD40 repeat protein